MSNTQEFIYKGFFAGFNKHDKSVHILKKHKSAEPYYLLKLDKEVEINDKVLVHYNDLISYGKGKLILGGVL